jgi:hypothetical protein
MMVIEVKHEVKEEVVTFNFPIKNIGVTQMKNIPRSSLPNLNGSTTNDLDAFLLEFDILCSSYEYIYDAQNLNLFPATLKNSPL